jgi:hypothetical protein
MASRHQSAMSRVSLAHCDGWSKTRGCGDDKVKRALLAFRSGVTSSVWMEFA